MEKTHGHHWYIDDYWMVLSKTFQKEGKDVQLTPMGLITSPQMLNFQSNYN
jgi:hypothetical protein|tara:strand:+ start:703 stop:855 length:153 start_codon:yes stop_codon:yes gene_type:complete